MAGVAQMFRVAYLEMPPVTRAYTTACILTTLSVQLDLLSPFQLYFNPLLIYKSYQFWRLFTPFFFFGGSISFMFLFNLAFMYRYMWSFGLIAPCPEAVFGKYLSTGYFSTKIKEKVLEYLYLSTG